jgi:alpha-mannosidase
MAKFNLKGAKLSSLRTTEEGIELRIFNPSNEQTEVVATMPFEISKAYKTDMIGNKLNTVSVLEGKISDSLTPWEIATYLIEF